VSAQSALALKAAALQVKEAAAARRDGGGGVDAEGSFKGKVVTPSLVWCGRV
jgi:hypothetical protein